MSRDDTIITEHYEILLLAHRICNECQKLSKRCPGGLCSNVVIKAKEIYYSQFAKDEKVRANGMREKQIDKLCNDLNKIFDEEYRERRIITAYHTAKGLYEQGYRKQSEGEWIDADPNGHLYRFTCSLCGKTKLGKGTPYCPNCGAKMKGGEDNA